MLLVGLASVLSASAPIGRRPQPAPSPSGAAGPSLACVQGPGGRGIGFVVMADLGGVVVLCSQHTVAGPGPIGVRFDAAPERLYQGDHADLRERLLIEGEDHAPAMLIAVPDPDVIRRLRPACWGTDLPPARAEVLVHQAHNGRIRSYDARVTAARAEQLILNGAPFAPGFSGSPVVHEGRVVGMVQRARVGAQEGWCLPAAVLQRFQREYTLSAETVAERAAAQRFSDLCLTPEDETDAALLERLRDLWRRYPNITETMMLVPHDPHVFGAPVEGLPDVEIATPLSSAAQAGNLTLVRFLVEELRVRPGLERTSRSQGVLLAALKHGWQRPELAEYLLSRPGFFGERLPDVGAGGWAMGRPLPLAATLHNPRLCRAILQHYPPDEAELGDALWGACSLLDLLNRTDIVSGLDTRVDPQALEAVSTVQPELVSMLLTAGAGRDRETLEQCAERLRQRPPRHFIDREATVHLLANQILRLRWAMALGCCSNAEIDSIIASVWGPLEDGDPAGSPEALEQRKESLRLIEQALERLDAATEETTLS